MWRSHCRHSEPLGYLLMRPSLRHHSTNIGGETTLEERQLLRHNLKLPSRDWSQSGLWFSRNDRSLSAYGIHPLQMGRRASQKMTATRCHPTTLVIMRRLPEARIHASPSPRGRCALTPVREVAAGPQVGEMRYTPLRPSGFQSFAVCAQSSSATISPPAQPRHRS